MFDVAELEISYMFDKKFFISYLIKLNEKYKSKNKYFLDIDQICRLNSFKRPENSSKKEIKYLSERHYIKLIADYWHLFNQHEDDKDNIYHLSKFLNDMEKHINRKFDDEEKKLLGKYFFDICKKYKLNWLYQLFLSTD